MYRIAQCAAERQPKGSATKAGEHFLDQMLQSRLVISNIKPGIVTPYSLLQLRVAFIGDNHDIGQHYGSRAAFEIGPAKSRAQSQPQDNVS